MSHNLKHTIIRSGAYVFNRRVPKRARESFGKEAVRVSLGTDESGPGSRQRPRAAHIGVGDPRPPDSDDLHSQPDAGR